MIASVGPPWALIESTHCPGSELQTPPGWGLIWGHSAFRLLSWLSWIFMAFVFDLSI
jgi:hypothetical protein